VGVGIIDDVYKADEIISVIETPAASLQCLEVVGGANGFAEGLPAFGVLFTEVFPVDRLQVDREMAKRAKVPVELTCFGELVKYAPAWSVGDQFLHLLVRLACGHEEEFQLALECSVWDATMESVPHLLAGEKID
jgi:hypothetical protein